MATKNSRRTIQALCLLAALSFCAQAADRVVLKDGFELLGDVEKLEQRIVVRSGPRVYLLGVKQIRQAVHADEVEPPIRLTLSPPAPPTGKVLESISGVRSIGEFDEFGRRTCVVLDGSGRETAVQQQATELYPTHVVVVGLNRAWLTNASLSVIPAKSLLAMLRRAIDPSSLEDRLKIVRFLLQAQRFAEARVELQQTEEKHPDAKAKTSELNDQLELAVAQRGVALAKQAVEVGRPQRAEEILKSLGSVQHPPTELTAAMNQLRESIEARRGLMDRTRTLLKEVRARANAPDDAGQALLDRALTETAALVSSASVDRLEPFRAFADQPSTSAEEQAALALSGWIFGAELAGKDLPAAIGAWRQSELLREVLLADTEQVPQLLSQFEKVGGKPDVAAAMARQLPPPALPASAQEPITFNLAVRDMPPLSYQVIAPPEYDRSREYPAIVTLHGRGGTPAKQLELWRSLAAENGVVLIAPQYVLESSGEFLSSTREHLAILAMLSDAKRRLAVDGDRVFLSGHGMGASAAWDVGMSHPDQFAGLIPISGSPAGMCKHYGQNLNWLPVFTIDGSIAHGTATPTENLVTRWQALGHNLIYAIYPGRGAESFVNEFPVVFEWMRRQRRPTAPKEVESVSAREFDRRFYWMEINSLSPSVVVAPELVDQIKVRPARLSGKLGAGDSLQITAGGVENLSVLLSPQLVQLDNPNLTVRVNRRLVHRGAVETDLETLVREIRRTGDRKLLVAKRLEVKNLLPRRP